MKIFCSGSSRLLASISNESEEINPIHSMFPDIFKGINFLGKLHNTKQHIQFIKYIKDEIVLPEYILPMFLTSYNINNYICEDINLIPIKKDNIKLLFDECEFYIFEICSMKLYKHDNFEVSFEHTTDYITTVQSEECLYNDLIVIRSLVPPNKKILFQTHFRPNIIYDNCEKAIEKREIIFKTIENFCAKNKNTFLHDPSNLLYKNNTLFDGDTHFTSSGLVENFNKIKTFFSEM